MSIRFAVALILLSSLCAIARPAMAQEYQTLAAGACKSALPVYDGNIRSRPLAVQNEGTALAFVTCTQQNDTAVRAPDATVAIVNTTDAAAVVNCTMVSDSFPPAYVAKSVTVAAGQRSGIVFAPDGGGDLFYRFAFSCGLPPGTGIAAVAVTHR